jgi:hypothetical protein
MKLEFSGLIFEEEEKKRINIKFYPNPWIGSRVIPFGRTDGHDKTNRPFSQLCERTTNKAFIAASHTQPYN